MQPPAFCRGSAKIAATVSGPAAWIASSISASRSAVSSASVLPVRKMVVLETRAVSTAGRPKGALKRSTPVNESAPRVTPW